MSVEHIVPESLGNVEHVLPKGVVCDACNNYFARKIEGPLLDAPYFRHRRSLMSVENKRGRVPWILGLVPQLKMGVRVTGTVIEPIDSSQGDDFVSRLMKLKSGRLYVEIPTTLDNILMSRFLAKVAVEALALRLIGMDGWREEILEMRTLQPLRHFARTGGGTSVWEFSQRPLYSPGHVFEERGTSFEVLHEFDFVYTTEQELFFVIAIFGEEFAIDMGSPSVKAYRSYLSKHKGLSPLAPW